MINYREDLLYQKASLKARLHGLKIWSEAVVHVSDKVVSIRES